MCVTGLLILPDRLSWLPQLMVRKYPRKCLRPWLMEYKTESPVSLLSFIVST